MPTPGKRLHVVHTEQRDWAIRPEKHRPIVTVPTQAAAEQLAKQILQRTPQGGEVITHRPNGEIRSSDTINRRDPFPPRDTEH